MKFEESITIEASHEKIFSVYSEVSKWPAWDKECEAASLGGDFRVGSEGKVKPKGAPESKITIVELTPNKSFTVECSLPLCKMRFTHLMQIKGKGSSVVNGLEFSGLLAPVFGRLIGKSISKTMPQTLAGLKSYVEAKG